MADTVELMRKRVLDMAIRGELVEQRLEERTAEELTKQFHMKKKSKTTNVEIEENEKPFEIPSSWIWVRLNEIGEVIGGGTPKTSVNEYWDSGSVPWISPADLTGYKEKYISHGRKSITELGLSKSSARLMPKGTVLFSSRAPIGYVAISSNEIATNQGFKSIVPYELSMNEYIYYYFQAFLDDIKSRSSGTTFKEISGSELGKSLFPLPPLAEQKRIVTKIEAIFAVIDQIGERKEEALKIIQTIRQTALQNAIMGMLVEQDESDEPASILYEKIQEEKELLIKEKKIKKEKPLPKIETDEVPFEIPESWEWVRLGEIASKVHYGYTASAREVGDAKMLRITDIQNGKVNWETVPFCQIEASKIEQYQLNDNDIVIARTGGTVGKSFTIKSGDIKTVFASYLIRIVLLKPYMAYYISSYLNSPYYWDQVGIQAQGTGQPNVNATQLSNLVVPLPPLAEQHRIVEKLDEIMDICDQMESILDGSSESVSERIN